MELIYRKNLIIQCLKCMRSGNCYHYNVFFDIGENYFIPIVCCDDYFLYDIDYFRIDLEEEVKITLYAT